MFMNFVKEGICYTKTMLLAALLRSQKIPIGFCYQRISVGKTPGKKHVIHALNAVYLSAQKKWIRLDPRREVNGKIQPFSIANDILSFPIRLEFDEINYMKIYSKHAEIILNTLKDNSDCIEMLNNNLPERI